MAMPRPRTSHSQRSDRRMIRNKRVCLLRPSRISNTVHANSHPTSALCSRASTRGLTGVSPCPCVASLSHTQSQTTQAVCHSPSGRAQVGLPGACCASTCHVLHTTGCRMALSLSNRGQARSHCLSRVSRARPARRVVRRRTAPRSPTRRQAPQRSSACAATTRPRRAAV